MQKWHLKPQIREWKKVMRTRTGPWVPPHFSSESKDNWADRRPSCVTGRTSFKNTTERIVNVAGIGEKLGAPTDVKVREWRLSSELASKTALCGSKPEESVVLYPEESRNPQTTREPTWDAPEIHCGEIQSIMWYSVWIPWKNRGRKANLPKSDDATIHATTAWWEGYSACPAPAVGTEGRGQDYPQQGDGFISLSLSAYKHSLTNCLCPYSVLNNLLMISHGPLLLHRKSSTLPEPTFCYAGQSTPYHKLIK